MTLVPFTYSSSSLQRDPVGIPYIWDPVADWSELLALPNPRMGDLCRVLNLGTPDSTGTARYSGTIWELTTGYFATTTDRDAFPDPIRESATIYVGPAGTYFDDLSYRSDSSPPFTWTLSSITDTDPSGIGVTRTGDFGLFNGRLYRLTAPLSLPGGGTRPIWLPPDVYAGSPTVVGYLSGNEDAVARNMQGWTDVLSAGGTRSITGDEGGSGETLLSGQYSGGAIGFAQLACGLNAISPDTRVYWRAMLRGDTQNGAGSEAGVRFAGNGVYFDWLQQRGTGNVRMTNGSNSVIDANCIIGGTGSRFAGVLSTAELWEGFDYGEALNTLVCRNGGNYTAARRPVAATVVNNALRFATAGASGTEIGQLRVSGVLVATW